MNRAAPRSGLGLQILAALLLCLLLVAGLLVPRLGVGNAAAWIGLAVEWARSAGPAGWVAFVAGQTLIAMLGVVPASLLGIASGAVYGVGGGFALAAIGTMVGGWLAFMLARSLCRPLVVRLLARRAPESRLARLDAEIARDGWRFVCLLRVSPVMPFAVTSYALGLTEIEPVKYLLGTLASLPALLSYVGVGALARASIISSGADAPTGPLGWTLVGVGTLATGLLLLRSGSILARCGLLPGAARVS